RLDPQRLGVKVFDLGPGSNLETARRKLIDSLVAHGVRAQLRTGNLLTGSAYVALDVFPSAPKTTVDWAQSPVQLPTTRGQFANAEATVESIISKLDQMPLKEIGDNLNKAITDLDLTLTRARHAYECARHLRQHQQSNRRELLTDPAVGRNAQGSQPRRTLDPRAHRLSRAPSRVAPSRQERRGEVRAARIARVMSIALLAVITAS